MLKTIFIKILDLIIWLINSKLWKKQKRSEKLSELSNNILNDLQKEDLLKVLKTAFLLRKGELYANLYSIGKLKEHAKTLNGSEINNFFDQLYKHYKLAACSLAQYDFFNDEYRVFVISDQKIAIQIGNDRALAYRNFNEASNITEEYLFKIQNKLNQYITFRK